MHRNRIRSVLTLVLALAMVALWNWFTALPADPATDGASEAVGAQASTALQAAFEQRQSGVWVEGTGRLVRHLPDDNEGSRHQRFILRVAWGQTILVSHNIDLAPRVKDVGEGDSVGFRGRYEWNDQGGVVHWTHHDPSGRREGGWLEVDGNRTR